MRRQTAPVSVIVPCYRCSATIERAVGSAFQQTMRPAECILIDDNSGDDTLTALKQLQKKYGKSWIKIISLAENGGPSVARNAGWDMARQPYLAFLDADDSWHPRKIELQYFWMVKHKEVALTGHAFGIWHKGEKAQIIIESLNGHKVSAKGLLVKNRFSTPTVMLKRELDFRFNEIKRFSEDYLLWLSLVLRGYTAFWFDSILAHGYKEYYGEGGQSGQLWAMEKGQLHTYWVIYNEGLINWIDFFLLVIFSLLKYFRRLLIKKYR